MAENNLDALAVKEMERYDLFHLLDISFPRWLSATPKNFIFTLNRHEVEELLAYVEELEERAL